MGRQKSQAKVRMQQFTTLAMQAGNQVTKYAQIGHTDSSNVKGDLAEVK